LIDKNDIIDKSIDVVDGDIEEVDGNIDNIDRIDEYPTN